MTQTANDAVGSLGQALDDAIRRKLLDVHTSMPGIVQSYDALTQTADISIAMKRTLKDGTVVDSVKLPNVRVLFPRTSALQMHYPLNSGDSVLLVFHERDVDAWRTSGSIGVPGTNRKFSLSDVVAIPGYVSDLDAIPVGFTELNDFVIKFEGGQFTIKADGTILFGKDGNTPDEPMVLGTVLKTYLESIHDKLDAIMDVLIAGDMLLVTSPGNPTAPNPAKISTLVTLKGDLLALKASPITDGAVLSDVTFTEKGA
jgi:hypothetical protein